VEGGWPGLGQRWTLGRAAEIQQQAKQKESMFLSRYFIDIHSACERGDLKKVKRYLQAGGDIEKKMVTLFNPRPSSNAISLP
jgi:hypothetical protein